MDRLRQSFRKVKTGLGRNAKRLCASFLVFAMLLTGNELNALASNLGSNRSILETVFSSGKGKGTEFPANTYILETSTGMDPGNEIQYIEIKYKDSDGNNRKQFIFPQEDSYQLSHLIAERCGSDVSKLVNINSKMGYGTQTDRLKKGAGASLNKYKTDQFIFTTSKKIKSVTEFNIFFGEGGHWTCQGIRLFEATKCYGLLMAGTFSDEWYVDFDGKLIAEAEHGLYNMGYTDGPYLVRNIKTNTNGPSASYATHGTQSVHNYAFAIDFTDVYGAGLECEAALYASNDASLYDMNLAEALTWHITYKDVYGETRFVDIPGITASVCYLTGKGFSAPTIGLAQQGQQLIFEGILPDCASIEALHLSLGSEDAMKNAHLVAVTKDQTRMNREEGSKNERITFNYIAIYDMNNTTVTPAIDGARLTYTVKGDPIQYKRAATADGEEFRAGTAQIGLMPYKGGALSFANKVGDYYLVRITTGDGTLAATKGDMTIMFDYISTTGKKAVTRAQSIRDLVREYYGYWPGSEPDFPYIYGASSGNTLNFFITADKVDHFTGAKISMVSGDDAYQFKNIQIYSLTNIGVRKIKWEEVKHGDKGPASHLSISRQIGKSELFMDESAVKILDISEDVLVTTGQDQEIDFVSATIDIADDPGFNPMTYSLSYEDALQNFNFSKERMNYTVSVKVTDSAVGTGLVTDPGNGDSGSRNHFYFQLVFENGTSAFVNANEQILGDQFNAGAMVAFQIKTNRDYGDVVSIRIIPDESSPDGDEERKYDKLQIDDIYVSESNAQGTHKQWESHNIGWIGVEYSEPKAESSLRGKAGKSMAEAARTFLIDKTTSVVDVELTLRTNAGDHSKITNDKGVLEPIYKDQMKGSVKGRIHYVDTYGFKQTYDFDMVESMFRYMNRNPEKETESGFAISDESMMFRENHSDRFIVSIPDIRSFTALEMFVSSDSEHHPYLWNIGGLSGTIVKKKGRLRINVNDEFAYDRGEEDNTPQFTGEATSQILTGSEQNVYIPVSENLIEVDPELGNVTTLISRLPASKDDTLNVFIFPSHNSVDGDIRDYKMNVELQYSNAFGALQMISEKDLKANYGEDVAPEDEFFYATGLSASGMIGLNSVFFQATSSKTSMCNLDYAVVQQVRSGTIIATYFVDLDEKTDNAYYPFTREVTGDPSVRGYTESEVVTLQFTDLDNGSVTKEIGLYPENQDIAVALEYKTKFDPNKTYRSRFVYLTDESILRIKSGQVVDIHFSENFVGEVTGICLQSSGDVEACVDMAVVTHTQVSALGEQEVLGEFSFYEELALSNDVQVMDPVVDAYKDSLYVKDLTMSFTTSGASGAYESGTSDPIGATIYLSSTRNSEVNVVVVDDLRKYLTDRNKNFLTGQTQTVRMLVTGSDILRKIEIEPQNAAGTAGWSLDSVTAKVGTNDPVSRIVNTRIYQGAPLKIFFVNVTVSALVQNNSHSDVGVFDEHRLTNDSIDVISLSGQPVYITPVCNGSSDGCKVYAVEVIDGQYTSGELQGMITMSSGRYIFTPPANTSGKTKYYRLTAESVEVPEARVIVNISIESVSATQETTDTPGTPISVSGNDTP